MANEESGHLKKTTTKDTKVTKGTETMGPFVFFVALAPFVVKAVDSSEVPIPNSIFEIRLRPALNVPARPCRMPDSPCEPEMCFHDQGD
jgi:hypothetical protein